MAQKHKRMNRLLALVIIFVSVTLVIACSAQTSKNSEDNPHVTRHAIESQILPRQRVFNVELPQSYFENTDQSYPVLFHVMSDRDALEMTRETVRELTINEQIPEIIVISLHHSRQNRSDVRPVINGEGAGVNADRYLEHLEKEMMPFLEREYRVSNDRILAGWSRFGVFTTYAMIDKPELFSGYIVRSSAPNSGALNPDIQNMLLRNKDLSAMLHVSIGSEGNEARGRGDFDDLKALLGNSAPTSFRWEAEVITGAGHSETFQPGLRDGLLFYFGQ